MTHQKQITIIQTIIFHNDFYMYPIKRRKEILTEEDKKYYAPYIICIKGYYTDVNYFPTGYVEHCEIQNVPNNDSWEIATWEQVFEFEKNGKKPKWVQNLNGFNNT